MYRPIFAADFGAVQNSMIGTCDPLDSSVENLVRRAGVSNAAMRMPCGGAASASPDLLHGRLFKMQRIRTSRNFGLRIEALSMFGFRAA